VSTRGVLWLKEEAQGEAADQDNVVCWERVELNLPGNPVYLPVRPRVSKRRKDGTLAADLVSYVDDIYPTGPTEEEAREASQVMAKELAHRGIRDVARKRQDISQTPGAWAGSVVHTTDSSVTIMVEQTKWDKTKVKLKWVPDVEYKPLERVRGFLNYVMQVYPAMIPYLRGCPWNVALVASNGFNKQLNDNREEDQVVKQPTTGVVEDDPAEGQFDSSNYSDPKFGLDDDDDLGEEYQLELEFAKLVHETNEQGPNHPFPGKPEQSAESGRDEPPVRVKCTTRMRDDVDALMKLKESSTPPKRRFRSKFITWLTYGFGNASGKGYGAALLLWDGVIFYRQGLWKWTITKEHS
jgi:hypothetical protein